MGNQASIWIAAWRAQRPAGTSRRIEPAMPFDDVQPVYDAAAQLFAVLSCPTRLAMLCHLRRKSLAVRLVAQACGISQPCASTQLKVLLQCGLVLRERRGREVVYAIRTLPLLEGLCDIAWPVDTPEAPIAAARPDPDSSR